MNKVAYSAIVANALIIVVGLPSVAGAQLFGNRTPGNSAGALMRSPFGNNGQRASLGTAASLGQGNPSAAPGGVLDGNERFVRGNRSRQDFVGSGRSDLTGFVGSEQAIGVGRVPAATDNFRLEQSNSARINRPLPAQPSTGMYYPKLVLDAEPIKLESTVQSPSRTTAIGVSSEIARRVKNIAGEKVEVFMVGSTAIVKGTVVSQRVAELAVDILSFEPGIDRVDNQLVVGTMPSNR